MFLWLKDYRIKIPARIKYQGNHAKREFPFTEGQLVGAFVVVLAATWLMLGFAMKCDQAAHAQEVIYYEMPAGER